jgi:hypothetical protein
MRLEPHQHEILNCLFERDEAGRFLCQTIIYSAPKKSGKTDIEGAVGEWLAAVEPGLPEIYMIGNDKEQAQTRAYKAISQQIGENDAYGKRNPIMGGARGLFLKPTKNTLEMKDGGFIKTVAIDFAGEAGANPVASLWDELWGVDRETQRRLWDEFTPVPTRQNSIRFVATYAGFKGESELLWELYERIVKKGERVHPTLPLYKSKDGEGVAYWDEGPEAHRMPWQTPQYYAGERARMRPSAYQRLHLNKWVSAETNFIQADQWDALRMIERPTL